MKNPISRLFLLLATFFYCYAVDENFNASLRWKECIINNTHILDNKIVFLAYFSKTYVNKFQWKINVDDPKLSEHDSVVASLLSVCLCRSEYPPLVFTTPYLESNGDDIIALCVIGNDVNEELTSMGIYDDEELYDYLILKHQELIPASVIDPFKHGSDASPSTAASDTDFTCFDQFFMQAKSIMEQRTCLFSASVTSDSHSLYSGPLMSLPLMTFSMENITQYCYTTVENTTHDSQQKEEGNYCFIQNEVNINRIACCCMKNPHACTPHKRDDVNSLYCLAKHNSFVGRILAEEYIEHYYKPSCTLNITAWMEDETYIRFNYTYGATDEKCPDNDMVYIVGKSKGTTETTTMEAPQIILSGSNQIKSKSIDSNIMENFCSQDDNSKIIFEITKCCSDRNFCNYDLISQDIKEGNIKTKMCKHRPALFQFLYPECELFVDLRDNEIRNLYIDFNARILNRTRRNLTEDFTYVIVKIIKEDSPDCRPRTFPEANVFIPFLICYLEEPYECILQDNRRNFTCQYLDNIYQIKTDSWFCFVQLKLEKNSITKYDTVAGHLEIKNPSDCYKNNVYNHTFCCINVFDKNQSESDCTVKKLTDRYKKYLKEKTEIGKITHGLLTECEKHGINDDRDCFGEDGCFDIRSVKSPKDEESNVAGCLGYAEDYTIQEKFEASLSLGCRLEENMNKCSMVYGPDGEERIVCCCNEKDENGECKTKANELPKQIGTPVSAFKELNS